MFARTDFAHQKLLLRESILELLFFAQTGAGRHEIERLAERHRQMKVKPHLYELWLDALCEALSKHDPELDESLERLWRKAMQKGIEVMSADSSLSHSAATAQIEL